MSFRRRLACLFLCLGLGACHAPVNVQDQSLHNSTQTSSDVFNASNVQFELDGQTLNSSELNDFVVQTFRGRRAQAVGKILKRIKVKLRQGWHQHARNPRGWNRKPDLVLQDVLLTETGESVAGESATAAITPDFAGKQIRLTLKGSFKNRWRAIPLERFIYTYEDGLVHQSFVGRQARARVLLDHSILMQVESVSESEIVARLDTTAIPDLYLKGLHRISVEYGRYYSDGLVKVGDPVHVDDLAPTIESAEIVYDDKDRPARILLKGQNYMVFPKFYYATLDGEFGFGYQTEVFDDGRFETTFHIPEPESFDASEAHVVILATPFGVALYEI